VRPEPPKPGDAIDLTFGSDRRLMEPAKAASGARYLSKDSVWEWWSKGPGGQLADAAGKPLATNCALYTRVGPPSAISR
jgi:membrane-bound inhibitor of C-type lysozyme